MAARYWIGTGGNTNNTANWSDTSGGAGGFSVPTASDDVFFDTNSGDAVINVILSCLNLDFTGYANTITFTSSLQVFGTSCILSPTMTFAGTNDLGLFNTMSLTSNGKEVSSIRINCAFANSVFTFVDDWTVGNFRTASANRFNGNNLYIKGNLQNDNVTFNTSTTVFHLIGTGTWSGNFLLGVNLVINTAGTITISGSVNKWTGTLTYIAGTVVTTGSTLTITDSCTLDVAGITWNNLQLGSSAATITLSDDLYASGTTTFGANVSGILTINGSQNIYCSGSAQFNIQQTSGATTLHMTGTGNLGCLTARFCGVPIIINTSGTITMLPIFNLGSTSLTYITGTVVTTANSLNLSGACTLDTDGIVWNIITGNGTFTLNSKLTADTIINSIIATTYQGTHGFETNHFTCAGLAATNRILTLTSGRTYLINSSLNLGRSDATLNVTSTSTGAIFTLHPSATQNVINTNATWIDSSAGQTIYTSNGVLTNTQNWSIKSGFFNFF